MAIIEQKTQEVFWETVYVVSILILVDQVCMSHVQMLHSRDIMLLQILKSHLKTQESLYQGIDCMHHETL